MTSTGESWRGKTAVVTGATSGIGHAVALALCDVGATVHGVGRDRDRLALLARDTPVGRIVPERADLTIESQRAALCERISAAGLVHALVHCAGVIEHATLRDASTDDLRAMLAANVEAPYALTKALLPALVEGPGDVVFVNSSVTRFPRAHSGQFAVTQHGLLGFADALRAEVNGLGVRVLSVFPGRTATPRTERLGAGGGTGYDPDLLLQPESVADTIVAALSLPRTAEVTEIHLRPTAKS